MDVNWEGTTEAFVSYSTHWLKQKNLLLTNQEPTMRLVRDYVARGILTKPERRGKEVIFSYIQLVQFLACRALTKDGWPLKKIAEDFSKASFSEILALVPESLPENKAMGLINSFKEKIGSSPRNHLSKPFSAEKLSPTSRSSADHESFRRRSKSKPTFSELFQRLEGEKSTGEAPEDFYHKNYNKIEPQSLKSSPPPTSSEPFQKDDFHSRMRNQHTERKELTRTLRELNAPNSGVELKKFTDFTIMPGTRLQLDNFTLSSMTRNKARSIAKAIELTLLQNLKFNEGEQND
jgi:hypothetical protein